LWHRWLLGAWRGLLYEVLALASWIAAFVLAQWSGAGCWRQLLPMGKASEPMRYAAGFVVVLVGAVFAGGLLAWLLKKLVEAIGLRPVDRTLGAAFGLARGLVLLLAAAVVVNMTPLKSGTWWQESAGAGVLTVALKGMKPVLPGEFGQYLPG
jgi:membrane protein required for colicin V production